EPILSTDASGQGIVIAGDWSTSLAFTPSTAGRDLTFSETNAIFGSFDPPPFWSEYISRARTNDQGLVVAVWLGQEYGHEGTSWVVAKERQPDGTWAGPQQLATGTIDRYGVPSNIQFIGPNKLGQVLVYKPGYSYENSFSPVVTFFDQKSG